MRTINTLFKLILFTAVIRPLSKVWPKNRDYIAFFPREGSRFIDNVAHFYDRLEREKKLPAGAYLVLTDKKLVRSWQAKGRNAIFFNPYRFTNLLLYLKTSLVIADSWQWALGYAFPCFFGARKVQIWHGIPLKKIERSNLDQMKGNGLGRVKKKIMDKIHGRYPTYDLVVSTSDFFTELAFSKSFSAKKMVSTGYPRNDVLFADAPSDETNIDIDGISVQALKRLKEGGKRIVLYSPTFRDSGGDALEKALNLIDLYEFTKKNNLVFVMKFHPYITTPPPKFLWPNILVYEADKDVTPLFKLSDLLVTDYSSVYFDYLLLDKPIIYFPFDYDKYVKHDRSFLFDYNDFTPGMKCYKQDELFSYILAELDDPDPSWKEKRHALRDKSFNDIDGNASLRLWNEIESIR